MRTVAGGGVLGDCWEPPEHQASLIEVTHTPLRLRKTSGLAGVGGAADGLTFCPAAGRHHSAGSPRDGRGGEPGGEQLH